MFAAIYIPNFSLQAAIRFEPDLRGHPVALIDSELAKAAIVQLNSLAKEFGVAEGMTASQAMARCGHLKIKVRSRLQEKSATEILLQTAYAFSPNIEATAPGVCTMELKGLPVAAVCDRRGFPTAANGADTAPLQNWSEKILKALALFYLEAKIGIAPTPELALLAARGTNSISIIQNTNNFVSDLPVAALNPAPEILEILSRWGIQTAGQFLALGKNEIAERLGENALELFARVSTDSIRPLKLISPSETFCEQMEFENEIETAEPLLFVLRRFVEQLSRRLEAIYFVVAEFHFQLGLASGEKYGRVFKIPSPTGNVEILFRMLQTHLETVRTESPIVSLQLSAIPAKPETHQFGLFESTLRNPNQFAETLARLTALLGAENVGTPQLISTNKPDSFRMVTPEFDKIETGSARGPRASADGSPTEIRANRADSRSTRAACAPLRRFRPPLPAHFEFREDRPALIRSQIFTGAISETRGPFFSSGNWWDNERWARKEWDVETGDGSLLRIFRSNDGDFVEGVYD
ncbi:MAG TPA: DNA polymerase Y family protein [Verrucomicrobiae bacterium]|nr:DNA polymerase Y family protein [Verrucomicrobiae bacterium]